jgi:hypothetical protein
VSGGDYVCKGLVRSLTDRLADLADFHDGLTRASFLADRFRTGAKVSSVGNITSIDEHTPVSNQQGIGSCVANAWADSMEMLMPRDHVTQLSRLALYWLCRRENGTDCLDSGTSIVTAAHVTASKGVCEESLYPYDGRDAEHGGTFGDRPTLAALQSCYRHRIDASLHIRTTDPTRRCAAIRDAINRGFPVVAAIALGKSFWNPPAGFDAALGKPEGQPIEGWHAVALTGYAELSDGSHWFLLRNSWGEGYGKDGHVMVTDDYIGDFDYCDELVVPTGVPVFAAAA